MKDSGILYDPALVHVTKYDNVKKGDLVKVSNLKDAFWVKIKQVYRSKPLGYYYFVGVIDNKLTDHDGKYNYGDLIRFDDSNILDLIKKGPKKK